MVSNSPVIFTRIWGSSSSDIFAVATLGAIQHYDGKTWSGMTISVPVNWFYDVWGPLPRMFSQLEREARFCITTETHGAV